MLSRRRIAVIGLGYVGLPVAVAFAKQGFDVLGFDIDPSRIEELREHKDRTREVEPADLEAANLTLSDDPKELSTYDFYIVTVPTPIDDACVPDISILLAASRMLGGALKRGDIVVYESTVYPGATEGDCVPVLEAASGLTCGRDFSVGYSPERINPGDKEHRFETITKVVSGLDAKTLDIVAETYGAVVKAGVHRAPSIKAAEAAKVIENTQRDLNIALMNELAIIFSRMGIDTGDVLEAAGTKWNFLRFRPGLVGGHCIGVDPYYLTYQAQRFGHNPEVVLAGRRANDNMGKHVATECVRRLSRLGRNSGVVTVAGITFKENVPDIRNSKVVDIIRELRSFGLEVQVTDPHAHAAEVEHEYGMAITPASKLKPADAVILAVAHDEFVSGGWPGIEALLGPNSGVVLDVKGVLDRASKPEAIELWRL